MVLLAGAVTGFSQGQIQMFDYGALFAVQIFAQEFTASGTTTVTYNGYSVNEVQGNDSADDNPGAVNYSSATLGAGYDVELLAGAAGDTLAELSPVSGSIVSSWLTGSAAGYWNAPTLVVSVPGVTGTAALAIAAWNTEGGTITTLAAAQADGVPWGISTVGSEALGYGSTPVPVLPAGITSFSLGTSVVPEPSTIALGVIGASAFLMRLRRKQ